MSWGNMLVQLNGRITDIVFLRLALAVEVKINRQIVGKQPIVDSFNQPAKKWNSLYTVDHFSSFHLFLNRKIEKTLFYNSIIILVKSL